MSDSPGPAPERVRDGAELAPQARGGLSTTLPALLDGDSDQRFRAFAHDLFALSARVDEILRRHANFVKEKYEISLSAPAITVLTAASRMDPTRPILTKDLAKYLRVTRSAASMAMNELVRAKMVRKRVSEHDQRVKFFELTDLGWETLEKTNTEKRVVNDVWFRGLERGLRQPRSDRPAPRGQCGGSLGCLCPDGAELFAGEAAPVFGLGSLGVLTDRLQQRDRRRAALLLPSRVALAQQQ